MIEGKAYHFGSGGAGRQHIPYGDWQVTPGAIGPWGQAHGALGIAGGSIWDPTLHRYREGIELHPGSSDDSITAGCIAIAGNQWPQAKAQILGMIKKYGKAYVHMGPKGASISPDPHADSPAAEKVVGSGKDSSGRRTPDYPSKLPGSLLSKVPDFPSGGFRREHEDRLAKAVTQEHKVTGNASIDVNVKAPKGTTVDTKADGMFKSVAQRRSNQMPTPSDWQGL
jgi:hypothetical protein